MHNHAYWLWLCTYSCGNKVLAIASEWRISLITNYRSCVYSRKSTLASVLLNSPTIDEVPIGNINICCFSYREVIEYGIKFGSTGYSWNLWQFYCCHCYGRSCHIDTNNWVSISVCVDPHGGMSLIIISVNSVKDTMMWVKYNCRLYIFGSILNVEFVWKKW